MFFGLMETLIELFNNRLKTYSRYCTHIQQRSYLGPASPSLSFSPNKIVKGLIKRLKDLGYEVELNKAA